MIELRSLGTAEIRTGTATLTPAQKVVFAAGLYLVLERRKRLSRVRLGDLLWPDAPDATRRHRMRQTLLQLKKLGVPVEADREELSLPAIGVRRDIDFVAIGGAEGIIALESVEFLPGYSPRLSDEFSDWVDEKRTEAERSVLHAVVEVLKQNHLEANWQRVEQLSLRALELDPFNEIATVARAEALAMSGAGQEAIRGLDEYIARIKYPLHSSRSSAADLRKRIAEDLFDNQPDKSRTSPFVGRVEEMRALSVYLADAIQGRGAGVSLRGEAGIGKTRLSIELSKLAQLKGVQVRIFSTRASDIEHPLSAFVDMVPYLRELPGALGCSQDTLLTLKRLTEFDVAENQRITGSDDAAGLYLKTRRAIFDLFDALAEEQCLLIVVDDVQWLDKPSLTLLTDLVAWAATHRLFLLFNSRPNAGPHASWLVNSLPGIDLGPLSSQASATVLRAVIGKTPVDHDELLPRLLSIGEGNPFFLQELGKHWLETGTQRDVPASLYTVISDRLSRLSEAALQLLQSSAVLAENATLARLEELLDYKPYQMLSAVQELGVAGMLKTDAETDDPKVAVHVRHDLLSSAAVNRLSGLAKSFLHRRAGEILEAEVSQLGGSASLLWACAFHWRNAGDRERAYAAARRCAEHMLEVGLTSDASRAFEQALDCCVSDEQRALVLSRLAIALGAQGEWEKTEAVLTQCRQLRRTIFPMVNHHDDVEVALFDARWRARLDNTDLFADLQKCVGSLDASPGHRISCGLLALKIGSNLGDTSKFSAVYETVTSLFGLIPDNVSQRSEVDMIFHSICGDITIAADATSTFLAEARKRGDPFTFDRALNNAAIACRLAGKITEAECLFRESLEHARTHGIPYQAAGAAYSLVRLYLACGNIKDARNALNIADEIATQHGDAHLAADRAYLSARLALEEGQIAEAAAVYRGFEDLLKGGMAINRRAAVLALGVQIGIAEKIPLSSLNDRVSTLERILNVNRALGWQDYEMYSLGYGLVVVGRAERAKQVLKDYASIYRRETWPLPSYINDFLASIPEAGHALEANALRVESRA